MLSKNIINTILIICCPFIVLFALGTWQLFRLNWKNNIIAKMNMPAVKMEGGNIDDFAYRKVVVEGVLTGIDLYIFAGMNSYYILTPMLLSSGEYILINKGLIDKKQKGVNIKPKKIIINGMLYCDSYKGINKLIKNEAKDDVWPWLDAESISKDMEVNFSRCVVWAIDKLSDNLVLAMPIKPRNYHMQYMITWYSLAFIWLIVCYVKNKSNFVVDPKHHKST
ncbi:SURF1 family protein [Candidatus Mesenet endosymbiont of Phosphuga atrata]|uniref:SURF1 family protein n=1 Tax=Candidatus Mesenet endosymbiont of Phosphuga atrata TaxID=3066221 RepID=UPI0030CD67AA